jgi:hypothetical protein
MARQHAPCSPRRASPAALSRRSRPTQHTTTHAEVIRAFLDVPISIEQVSERAHRVTVKGAGLRSIELTRSP